jgi:DNA-binding MarR family transcriptional regulator
MADINDVRQLTRSELSEIVRKGEDKELIKLCIEEEDRRMNILIQERLKKEAEIAQQLSKKVR